MKFGTSGLRGLAVDFTPETCRRYVAAFMSMMKTNHGFSEGQSVFIGRDLRASSPEIAKIVADEIAILGYDVGDCGALPTPALALYAETHQGAAIMVTGSHIPADRNGLKFYRVDGEINKTDEGAILDALETPSSSDKTGAIRDCADATLALYRKRNLNLMSENQLRGKRIGIYAHSSVARDIYADLMSAFGAEVIELDRSESFIPIDTEAISEEVLSKTRAWAKAHQLDAIISSDGDADRPFICDETGAQLAGDLIGYVAAVSLGAKTIVTTVSANSAIDRFDGEVIRTKIGSPFVIDAMQDVGGEVIGFEPNGGTLLGYRLNDEVGALMTRDSVLPILAVLGFSAKSHMRLSVLSSHFKFLASRKTRVEDVPMEVSAGILDTLRKNARAHFPDIVSVSQTDGERFTLEDGSVLHFRPSGNAPEFRIYSEAATEAAADAVLARGVKFIKEMVAAS